jgi:hypothetical protein
LMTSLIECCPMKSETEFKPALNEAVAAAAQAGDLIVEWSRQAAYEVRQNKALEASIGAKMERLQSVARARCGVAKFGSVIQELSPTASVTYFTEVLCAL